ncbi:MAG TPA: DUF2235 domain-containing protein [Candidatus Binatia bacterium]|nr:DUF2235 domain-containing protein [Candidatus Binatia bacterium]
MSTTNGTVAAQPTGTAAASSAAPKSIVLFSDGTGNSSAKLFKTNVWRMYEAVDLGPAKQNGRPQIAYYDDGVGTSALAPLALLGGAVGWGLKRNVLDLYRYACRNYRPGPEQGRQPTSNDEGDDIYGFGFSRGAFTMRVVIAMIAKEGLIRAESESELNRLSLEAYRAFRKDFKPRKLQLPLKLFRTMRDGWVQWRAKRRNLPIYDSTKNYHPVIRFVGVWDTVAAYGGPFVELTRFIDNWIFGLSMPDYELSDRVRCARHALALDDERDSFHPLLWDELHERDRIASADPDTPWITEERLQQVWFTGMHADVGGGYPDESLSYVSLLWMLNEAEQTGLRTLDRITDRYEDLANSCGPIHDSRSGTGVYYRYQPRRIAAWTDPVDDRTIGMHDPLVLNRRKSEEGNGLLREVMVHESAIHRLVEGTDSYAPISLPPRFKVVPQDGRRENADKPDSQNRGKPRSRRPEPPLVSAELRERLRDDDLVKQRVVAMERVWDRVWYRRINYFVTVALTVALVSMPWWISPAERASGGVAGWIATVLGWSQIFLPDFTAIVIDTFAAHPYDAIVLLGFLVAFWKVNNRIEASLRDDARRVWRCCLVAANGEVLLEQNPRESYLTATLRNRRNSAGYQRAVQWFKWKLLPEHLPASAAIGFSLWWTASMLAPDHAGPEVAMLGPVLWWIGSSIAPLEEGRAKARTASGPPLGTGGADNPPSPAQ